MVLKLVTFFLFFFIISSYSESSYAALDDYGDLGQKKEFFLVDKIEIEGSRKVEPEAILERLTIYEGSLLTNYDLKAAITQIYSLKYFEKVEAYHKIQDGKNILVFKILEKPVIRSITFEGNDDISNDDLAGQIKTKEYNILDVSSIKKDIQILEKYYEEKGFYLAQIDYDLIANEVESLDLVFRIKEFQKVKVKKILFLGNKEIGDEELKNFMQTREESLFSGLSGSGNFKDFNFQIDIERIKMLYKSKGFLQVNIGNPIITVTEDKKWVFITLKIQEGPKFYVNNIFFSGEILFSLDEMRQKIKLKSEDVYSETTLREDIQVLTEMYQDKGYAFANVLRNLKIVPGEHKVDITYSFEKGEIAYFGKISVKGNSRTRDKVIRRELRIYEGMRFSGSKLRISKENVNRLGFFEQGSVIFNTVSSKKKDNVLDVEISIKERQTGQISMGAGYSTVTQGFFQAAITQNNFMGRGQNLNFNVTWSQIQQNYNIGFTEPYFLDTKWTLGGDIYQNFNGLIRSFVSEKKGFDLRVGYPVHEYARLFFMLRNEQTNILALRNPTINREIETGDSVSVRSSLIFDQRNNVFEPTDGIFASAVAELAGFYGEQRWFRSELEGRYYKPIWSDLIFKTRLRFAQLTQTTDRDLPRTEKFQMGGPRNMRGFNFEDIGPQAILNDLDTGRPTRFNLGGQSLFLSTFEFEHPLVKEAGLKWVLFYDAGNVFERPFENEEELSLRQNYGFGFRWFSPIGVLRFEFGYPVAPKDYEARQQFHFDIGQLF